jgi:lantibiotic modifying enzyme
VVAAEVAELLVGDVPFFDTTPRVGRLAGPRGTGWLPAHDLAAAALARWRAADLGLERQVVRAALVSAYLNEGWLPSSTPMPRVESDPTGPDPVSLDRRRRRLAARLVGKVIETAVRAEDGSVTWIAPVLNATGWATQPLNPDLYNGAAGVAVLLSAYQRETDRGRADPVAGVAELRDAVLHTLRLAQDRRAAHQRAGTPLRPPSLGGYVGAGSQIWTWLTLDRWGAAGPDGLDRAVRAARQIVPEAEEGHDLLTGAAGAIVPLLLLGAKTRDTHWCRLATTIGERIVAAARYDHGVARWPTARWPAGLGGFAHGATGIGWALHRLALATGDERFAEVGSAAFGYEETLYDPAAASWRDLRDTGVTAAAWCHGAVGIGLALADLQWRDPELVRQHPEVVRRAANATWASGFGWGHSLCHGDFGAWELLDTAIRLGLAPGGLTPAWLVAQVVGGVERYGPVTGLAREAFSPGLVSGEGGIAYQLLRMDPESDLPSVLLLDGDG